MHSSPQRLTTIELEERRMKSKAYRLLVRKYCVATKPNLIRIPVKKTGFYKASQIQFRKQIRRQWHS